MEKYTIENTISFFDFLETYWSEINESIIDKITSHEDWIYLFIDNEDVLEKLSLGFLPTELICTGISNLFRPSDFNLDFQLRYDNFATTDTLNLLDFFNIDFIIDSRKTNNVGIKCHINQLKYEIEDKESKLEKLYDRLKRVKKFQELIENVQPRRTN